MRAHLVSSFAALAAVLTLAVPSLASAQVASANDSAAFLVTGIVPAASQSSGGGGGGGGIGFGVKGGWLYSSFDQAGESLGSHGGWEAGIFFGGNRNGVLGVMGEVLYAKKSYEQGLTNKTTDLYYLEIPVLLRVNIGSSNRNKGVIVYGLGGPVFDVNLKAKQEDLDVKDNYESTDFGIMFGGGIEVSRIIFEGRFNWGLMNLLKSSGLSSDELKNQSFALLVGVRFN